MNDKIYKLLCSDNPIDNQIGWELLDCEEHEKSHKIFNYIISQGLGTGELYLRSIRNTYFLRTTFCNKINIDFWDRDLNPDINYGKTIKTVKKRYS